jgi:hypothetical protein
VTGKMEGYCSTGQSPQRAVVPMEEEEEEDDIHLCLYLLHKLLVAVLFVLGISCVCEWHRLFFLIH